MTPTFNYVYYWWIKCWQFHPIIATNHQSLLLANISSYMVVVARAATTKNCDAEESINQSVILMFSWSHAFKRKMVLFSIIVHVYTYL